MSITPEAFIQKYTTTKLNEKSGAALHFIDLCDLLEVPRPDGTEAYRFEQPVLKVAGGKGFADVYSRGKFGWEYKSKGADLQKAYLQLLSYREDLDNPPLLLVSDMQTVQLHTNFTGTQKAVHTWTLDDLRDEGRRAQLRQVWLDPGAFNPAHRIELATVAAVESLAKVSSALKGRGVDPEQVAHFLVRVMFTLFAEDADLIPSETFKRLLEAAREYPEDFAEMCQELFAAMKVGKKTVVGRIPYINGGVFEDTSAPALERDEVNRLYDAAKRNWRQIDPTIFGTLFELVINPDQRWQLGAHYTPLTDILDVVEPVIMKPLRAEWEAVRSRLGPLLAEIEQAQTQGGGGLFADGALGQSHKDEALRHLEAFQERLAGVRVLDPAMGSGNFLYVTMRLLLDLEAEVRETIRAVTQDVPPAPKVGPQQMLGMEVNRYAHEIAGMVLWIGYLQWMREHGERYKVTPVLGRLPGLVCQDAVFDLPTGEIRQWPEAEFIVGNPPFLGYSPMREQLGEAYVNALRAAFKDRIAGFSDFVCYFFELARENVERGKTKRAGLIATNSIASGENAQVLERILKTGGIFQAWPDRAWIQSGAAVRTSVILFDDGTERERVLLKHTGDERDPNKRQTVATPVENINADLRSGPDLRRAQPLPENAGKAFIGVLPTGTFDIPAQQAEAWKALPNPSGVKNEEVLRRFYIGDDINHRDSGRYTIDFTDLSVEKAAQYEEPFQFLVKHVKPVREKNKRQAYRERWWQYAEARPGLRRALEGLPQYLVTSRVSKHRFFVFLKAGGIPGDKLVVFPFQDNFHYGVLNSTLHTLWAQRRGSTHGVGNDLAYTPSTAFESFPFPRPTETQREVIETAAKQLQDARELLTKQRDPKLPADAESSHQVKTLTLTGMYNLLLEFRETGQELVSGLGTLDRAHQALDQAVAAAYGWAWPMDEETTLTKLLDLNLERAQGSAER